MEKRLKLYVISCHADKPLGEQMPTSVYDCPIQAGAALTDIRTCERNDHDGFPESISDRNARYSEASAMWWVGGHIDTPYVGFAHYRRRLDLSDDQIRNYMDQDIDVVTTVPVELPLSIEESYRQIFYSADWNLFMEIIKESAPEDYAFAKACFAENIIHECNLNIFKAEWYRQYCDWAFPLLDAFYRRSTEKTDRYQRRDVAMLSERLSHLFVMKLKAQGKKIVEENMFQIRSVKWLPEQECDLYDAEEVYAAGDRLYRERQIGRCGNLLHTALNCISGENDKLRLLSHIMWIGQQERKTLPATLHEYLPAELRADLCVLTQTYEGLRKAVWLYFQGGGAEAQALLADYVKLTHFSKIAATGVCVESGRRQEEIDRLLSLPIWEQK